MMCNHIRKFSEKYHTFISEPDLLLFHAGYICNFRTQYGMAHVETANESYWRNFVFFVSFSCRFYACPTRFWAWTCICFSYDKFFSTFNKLFFEAR